MNKYQNHGAFAPINTRRPRSTASAAPVAATGLQRKAPRSTSDDMTREEMDAKLDATHQRIDASEARIETRFVELGSKIDTLSTAITGERGVLSEMRDLRADNKSTRLTIIATGVATVVSIIAALISVLAFGGDQFSAGRDLGGSLGQLDAKMNRIEAGQTEAARLAAEGASTPPAAAAPAGPSK